MSPVTNVDCARARRRVRICSSRRVFVPRSNATTGVPSRTSSRTVHAPMQPRAPVTRNRSSRHRAAVARPRLPRAAPAAPPRTGTCSSSRPIRSISTVTTVAVAEEPRRVAEDADAAGRAGRDHVAGLERERPRAVADDLGDAEVHPRGVRVLDDLVVDPAARSRGACGSPISSAVTSHGPIGQNVSSDLPRTHWPSPNWMSRADTSFEAGVAEDVVERLVDRHVAGGPADHDRELRLVVDLLR